MKNLETLREQLHAEMVNSYELVSLYRLADIVLELEIDNGCKFTDVELTQQWQLAADLTCDSIIDNYRESEGYEDGRYDNDIELWEAKRPSSVRLSQLKTISDSIEGVSK